MQNPFKSPNRAAILAAGAAVQILTGIPAAWGVFQNPVMETYQFSEDIASYAFHILIAFFGLGCVIGGFLQDKKGPRIAALWGTALLCGGFLAAAFLPVGNQWLFFALFSAPAGLGSAFLYPAIFSCAQKWYADKKGFATGVIGCSVGLSGAFLTIYVRFITNGFILFGIEISGIRAAFWSLAALMFPVCLLGSLMLQNPPPPKQTPAQQGKAYRQTPPQESYITMRKDVRVAAQQPIANAKKARKATAKIPLDYSPRQMLKTRQYWLCAASVCFSTPAVLLFSPILVRLGQERGLGEVAALSVIMFGSVGSAAGRLLMPMLSDKITRRRTDLCLFAASAALSLAFLFAQGWLFVAVYAGLTFCYSGLAAVLPAFSTDLFGLPHAGVNYGFLALGQSVGSLAFPLLANFLALSAGRHYIAIAAAVAGFAMVFLIQPSKKNNPNGGQT
ncbi:MAG: MFS transporter [Faecalibacterium sp.]